MTGPIWKCRGAGKNGMSTCISNIIFYHFQDFICLQETKRDSFDASFVKKFCPKKFDMFEFVPSVGNLGGLITIWMSSVFTATPIFSVTFVLGVRLTSTQSNDSWTLVNIYGPCVDPTWTIFTNWLFDLDIPNCEDWLILGDFNFISNKLEENFVLRSKEREKVI